ncbi:MULTISPECIES: MFS transporter [Pseudoalteromonas]|uniref:MFS transporter n=1 Tax=Pseudoalteromonas TaxID=53246 RepID=UPI000FFE8902|nr:MULTISPECIES: MFS transporter [Pseudoalteromonas]MDW7548887.1 MFS transporter [Pseudoalteromonas peptidolytica]RXF06053.1 MFS transporter [Pseudoalteromonas sp. PS5]
MTSIRNNTKSLQATSFSLKPMMFETFVCTMAMMAFAALAAPIARVIGLSAWQVGAAVTVAGLAWVIMARVWGRLSDRKGRRPVMLFGLTGFVVSYFILALFIDYALHSAILPVMAFIGIVVGRGIAGFFYAAVPVTTAALVADHIAPDSRAGAMAGVGAASAAGMVIGPGLAGLLGPISLSLPLYITAFFPVIALLVLWRVLPKVELHAQPSANTVSLGDKRLRSAVGVAFVSTFSVAVAQIIVGFFVLDQLQLEPAQAARAAGVALAIVGVALIIAQIVLQKLTWQPKQLILCGGLIAAVGFVSAVLAVNTMTIWASYAIAGFGMGWIYPSVSALAANSVNPTEQGAAAGIVSAAQGLGIISGPIVGTGLYGVDNTMPYLLIANMLVVIVFWAARR